MAASNDATGGQKTDSMQSWAHLTDRCTVIPVADRLVVCEGHMGRIHYILKQQCGIVWRVSPCVLSQGEDVKQNVTV